VGILGLLILIGSLIVPAVAANRNQNYLYLAFLLFFSLCFLTESVLNSQKGVVFFAFFNSLFAFHLLKRQEGEELRKGPVKLSSVPQ
jgi:O-antigen ligase